MRPCAPRITCQRPMKLLVSVTRRYKVRQSKVLRVGLMKASRHGEVVRVGREGDDAREWRGVQAPRRDCGFLGVPCALGDGMGKRARRAKRPSRVGTRVRVLVSMAQKDHFCECKKARVWPLYDDSIGCLLYPQAASSLRSSEGIEKRTYSCTAVHTPKT